MTVTVNHAKTNAITDWTQAQLDEQIALGNFPAGTTLANIVLPSDWNDDHTLTGLGTMAEQNANTVAITGGTATLSSVTTPSVTATTNNLTLNSASTGTVTINTASANNTFLLVKDDTTAAASTTGLTVLGASSGLGRLALRSNKALYVASGSSNNISFLTNSGVVSEGSTQMLVGHTASAVNYVQVTGAATTSFPIISAQGSDTNISMQLYAKGTGAINFWTSNGGSRQFQVAHTAGTIVNYATVTGAVTGANPAISTQGSDTNISMSYIAKGTGQHIFATNGTINNQQLRVSHTTSAVNYVQVTGAPTSAGASSLGGILFTGSDTNVNGAITMKGTGYITFSGSGLTASQAFRVNTTNAVTTGNLLQVQGAAAGSAPSIQAINGPTGTDTNIDLALTPKGTGLVRFGTYVAGALTATGYINIKAADGTTYKVLVST